MDSTKEKNQVSSIFVLNTCISYFFFKKTDGPYAKYLCWSSERHVIQTYTALQLCCVHFQFHSSSWHLYHQFFDRSFLVSLFLFFFSFRHFVLSHFLRFSFVCCFLHMILWRNSAYFALLANWNFCLCNSHITFFSLKTTRRERKKMSK